MVTLANIQGSSLIPDRTQSLNVFLESFGTPASREQQRVFQEEVDVLSRDPDERRRESALVRISAINPQVAQAVSGILERGDAREITAAKREVDEGFKQAKFINKQKTFAGKHEALLSLARDKTKNNQDVSRLMELLAIPSEEGLDLELDKMQTLAPDVKTALAITTAAAGSAIFQGGEQIGTVPSAPVSGVAKINASKYKPESVQAFQLSGDFGDLVPVDPKALSAIGKLKDDFANGKISRIERDKGIAKAVRDPALVQIANFEPFAEKEGARRDSAVSDEIRLNAREASRQLPVVRNLTRMLESTTQGALRQFIPTMARFIPGLDLLFDTAGPQAAQAMINQFVLDEMSKFKGNTSDRELAFARQTVAQLGNSAEANKIIMRNFANVIFLAQQENRQFDDQIKAGVKPRDFVFNFNEVIFPDHPKFKKDITLSDIQDTAFDFGMTIENTMKQIAKEGVQ